MQGHKLKIYNQAVYKIVEEWGKILLAQNLYKYISNAVGVHGKSLFTNTWVELNTTDIYSSFEKEQPSGMVFGLNFSIFTLLAGFLIQSKSTYITLMWEH